jgi:two-component system LytT family response regulator
MKINMLTAIIIDDMPLAIDVLSEDLKSFCPEVKLIGNAEGVLSGAKLLKETEPDILFLDIQMKDGSGFDLLEIVKLNHCSVIFTTASNDHAIKAFQFSAIDYLLKPIDPDLLITAVEKVAQRKDGQKEQLRTLQENLSSSKKPDKIVLHTLEKIAVVAVKDIIRCEASGNYTLFHIHGQKKILVTRTLKDFEKLLEPHSFLRVHQSHLVNLDHIKSYEKTEGGYLMMSDGNHVSVSVRKKAYVVKVLERI